MPVTISRLRHWFALAAIVAAIIVGGVYFYARHRVQNALKQIPGKLDINIQQSAQGYTYSQSNQGRTIFKIQAAKAVFRLDQTAELQNVVITLYGRDASRFDQIYGSDFEYNPKSGDVTAHGEVQIDLEANPAGMTSPDQAAPKELKNPIHLKTSGLVFNQKSGDAYTKERVDFRISQASGSASGMSYVSKSSALTLDSQVAITLAGPKSANVTAGHGIITKEPREVVLQAVRMDQGSEHGDAENATLFLSPVDTLQRILAQGNVHVELGGKQAAQLRSDQLELLLDEEGSNLRTADFSGNVEVKRAGDHPMQSSAGRVIASFSGENVLNKVHADHEVRIQELPKSAGPSARSQTMLLTASAVDFLVAQGQRLSHAETSGAAEINVSSASSAAGKTVISAGKFTAQFDGLGQLASVRGAPDARIVSSNPKDPDRIGTSDSLEASFAPNQGMETAVQQGNVVLTEGDRKAWADRARYTAANQVLELTGSPRIQDQNMTTTARLLRLNRATGEGFAQGEVKSTYKDLKPQPGGALLASASPIHVTAQTMTAHRDPATAFYNGGARLWQDANVITAPSIEFDRNHRSLLATGSASQPVSTVLMDNGKKDRSVPVTIDSGQLQYVDNEREASYSGGVTAKSPGFVLAANQMNVFLQPEHQSSADASSPGHGAPGTGNLDHIIAQGHVVVTQPTRHATGDQLTYTAAEQKFVLTGGPPSIFDAERGKITGVSLTLFRADDRVLVEGTDTSPTVTHTRVAR